MLIEEEVPEDQIEAELAPLTTQLAYVAGQLGRHGDAVSSLEVSTLLLRLAVMCIVWYPSD